MQIGILQCGHTSGREIEAFGDFDAMFARLFAGRGWRFRTWNVVDMEFPEGPRDADGWIVTGSKHGAYEDHAFIPPLEDLIRAIAATRVPLVGICFGHQIVAQAMGGEVVKFPGGWGIGRTPYAVDGLGTVHITAWHQDQVVRAPSGATVAGVGDHCAIAALDYGTMWTIQPHPEFSQEITAAYVHEKRGTGEYPEHLMDRAAEGLAHPLQSHRVADLMADVLEGRRSEAAA